MRLICSFFILILVFTGCAEKPAAERHLSDYVNPFIGASTNTARSYHGLGKTFPGAATPFGMTQVSPNTITGGDNGSGYSYEHTSIEGFALTQMSGVGWYGDLGNFLVMPTTGKLKTCAGRPENTKDGYRSAYSKESETAKAGYYSVFLSDYQIKTETSATPRGGILRFTFPENKQSRIQIDLARRVGGTSIYQYIEVEDKQTIRGWMKCTPDGGGWGNGDGKADYTVYFYARFSKPPKNSGFWSADIPDGWERKRDDVTSEAYQQKVAEAQIITGARELEGKHLGFFTEFETSDNEEVTLKVAISFVDMDGAKKNYQAELDGHSFDEIRHNAQKAWDEALGKITVTGGTEDEKTIFYTALYHTMIDPRLFSDVDGRFTGGDHQIHVSDKFNRRTIFSGWDVFRSQFPLQTIINPELVSDEINSLIALAEETKTFYYERWEFLNAYSGCMIGNPAISIITDAYMKGIRSFDTEKAFQYALNTSQIFGNGDLGYSTVYGISNTLEYAYSDWCMAELAKALGKENDMEAYEKKAQAYRNIFDTEDKMWFRPRKENGEWEPWPEKGILAEWYGCIESNPYQQGWFVPHDVDGMVELMGGREQALKHLVHLFEQTPEDYHWNDYYNHANEPVHHVPFIFNRLGAPWLTQKWTRHICKHAYKNEVEGLTGNEDVGQMSAWYILAASGIHPICPGDTRYEITAPVFSQVVFNLDSGKTFTITANNNSPENIYIQDITLNGKTYPNHYLLHEDIINGGELVLNMGKEPKK